MMDKEFVDLDKINEVIANFALGDFSKRLEISNEGTVQNAVKIGINMLGEELQDTMISRDFFSRIFNSSKEFMVVINKEGLILEMNNAAFDLLDIDEFECNKCNLFTLIAQSNNELVEKLKKHIQLSINGEFETSYTSYDGGSPISISVTKIINRNDSNDVFLVSGRDLTEKKNQEQRLYMAVVDALEKERKRLAYDLHDSFSQDLNAIKIFIDTLRRMDKDDPDFGKSIDRCNAIIENATRSAKGMAFDLLPKSLEKGDLLFAIQQLSKKYPQSFNFNLQFEVEEIDLPIEIKTIIYRIFQEFINNSVKHSNAETLTTKVSKEILHYEFTLMDNGIGFNIKEKFEGKGNGLHNLTSRLNAIKAKYKFESSPENGTTLTFSVR